MSTQFDEYPSNELGALPNVRQFGGSFSYAAWNPNTVITLCNVPWGNDYRDIVHFESKAALSTFLNDPNRTGPSIKLGKLTHARPGTPIRVNIPFEECYRFNYIRVVNGAQPVTAHTTDHVGTERAYQESEPQTLFYFVTDIEYVAPNTTVIYVQLDVWQSFCHSVSFGQCYIERGHVGIANENSFDNYGRDYLTIPEGLDVGNEYIIAKTGEHVVADTKSAAKPIAVMVVSTTSLVGPYGDINEPILTVASGSGFDGLPNGCDIYIFQSVSTFVGYMDNMKDMPWVTQGIVSVTAIPDEIFQSFEPEDMQTIQNAQGTFFRIVGGSSSRASVWPDLTGTPAGEMYGNMHDTRFIPFSISNGVMVPWRNGLLPARYSRLKKFLTSPYTVVELTSYSGNPLLLKPENMPGEHMKVIQKMYFGTPSPRMVFIPYKYNAYENAPDQYDSHGAIVSDGGEMFDMMTGIMNFPTFSVVNNGYMGYMAANSNTIAYQHSSADWSQDRATSGALAGYGNAIRGADLSADLAKMSNNAMWDTTALANTTAGYRAIQGAVNAGVGIAGSAVARDPSGVIGGAMSAANAGADYAIQTNQNSSQAGINSSLNQNSADATRRVAGQNADTNLGYANYAAQGDYQNAIAGINARVQDAKMIQPTTTGQVGGDAFNLAMFKWGVFAKVKTIQPAAMAVIGEYWLRYGYAVNRFGTIPADFQVMQKFTYWKLRETYITSSTCPENFRQTIRGIFEKGVTVWSDPNDIGSIDIANNEPKAGITL